MRAAQGPVDFDGDRFPQIRADHRFSQGIRNESPLALQICFSSLIHGRGGGERYLQRLIGFGGGRRFVQIIPEIYVIYPVPAARENNVNKVGLQISRSVVIAAAGQKELLSRRGLGPVIKALVSQFLLQRQHILKPIHRHRDIDDRLRPD